jgi:hypothetical protein
VFEAEGECAVCPELAIADISPQEADSRFVQVFGRRQH